jgi:hypothetical protein
VENSEDNRHFHFDTIDERKFVFGGAPDRVLSKEIDTSAMLSSPSYLFGLRGDNRTIPKLTSCLEFNSLWMVHVVAGAKNVGSHSKELIVDEAAVEGHETHQHEQVARLEEQIWEGSFETFISEDKGGTYEEKNGAVAHITEHHPKEERESDYCEHRWIGLQVPRNTIGIDNLLVDSSEFICFDVCRPVNSVILIRGNTHSTVRRKPLINVVLLVYRRPKIASECLILPFHHV